MFLKKLSFTLLLLALLIPMLFAAENHPYPPDKKDRKSTETPAFYFDESTPDFSHVSFGIDESDRLKPMANDFELLHFAPMSNKSGERAALITVKNNAGGRRFLKRRYIVATFADAEQAYPMEINKSVGPGERLTTTLYFGARKFPLVRIEVQP